MFMHLKIMHLISVTFTNLAGSTLIVSEWNDKEAFTQFINSEQFAQVTTWGKEEILTGRPRHKVYANA